MSNAPFSTLAGLLNWIVDDRICTFAHLQTIQHYTTQSFVSFAPSRSFRRWLLLSLSATCRLWRFTIDTTGARDGTIFRIIKMFLRDVSVGAGRCIQHITYYYYYYYIVALFMWITSNRSLKFIVQCFSFRAHRGIWSFRQRTIGDGPRTNKFIRVILRLIKKTFAKWWNKCKYSKIEIWIVPYGKQVEVSPY